MANVTKDLGAVTAYAKAVERGFVGTEDEWIQLQMQAGTNAQRAQTAADESENAAQRSAAQAGNAADSAQAAQESASNAAGSATDAGNQAANAAASATRATEQATNAAISASAAAQSEASAKQSEQNVNATIQGAVSEATASAQKSAANAAQSAEDAAASAQEAREVVQTAAQIEDAVASFEKVWSSQRTLDRLCPRFEESGQVVSCYPVEGYPLGVVSQIKAVQAGSGEPSTNNIRPISGWDTATVTRCGKNLLAEPFVLGVHRENGFAAGTLGTSALLSTQGFYLKAGRYFLSGSINPNSNLFVNGMIDKIHTSGHQQSELTKRVFDISTDGLYNVQLNGRDGALTEEYINKVNATAMLEYGESTAEYEPYQGNTYTVQFDETVYGGTYDWNTGELMITHQKIELTGTEYWNGYGKEGEYKSYSMQIPDGTNEKGIEAQCSHYPNVLIFDDLYYGNIQACYVGNNNTSTAVIIIGTTYKTATEFKAYLAEQYAAGTPVTVVYPLAEPIVIAGTGQMVTASDGVNTLYSDTGDTSVSGRADPVRVMEQMLARIEALENAAVSGE